MASFLFSASGSGLILRRVIEVDSSPPFTRTTTSVATHHYTTAAIYEARMARTQLQRPAQGIYYLVH
jgi:hypothetical protein